ncbi:SDR family oxidoreductase [Natronococcus occultus]|uniref:Ketoreductase domain-containing protein n=1 Tax=Natronococcus occultus SP4 TaxID=694430 RepID=L0JVX2_9EURY|nr:SDR family oxidoreductase [Natronococcus occultus]AGB36259.1 short-chain dehydrogenase of unknown substrate specificity [Natronococcus occultus SP4]
MLQRFTNERNAETEPKPLSEQVVVITGASSGIGLTTARMAADRGARVVLAARSEDALREAVEGIEDDDGDATFVVADVGDREDVREIARVAEETYGGVDTWINGAAVSIYGRLEEIPVERMREQFDTNVWGLLYGSLEALDVLEDGGTIINVGSIVSDRSIMLQGSYSASKQAVKAFTDALRMELEDEGRPINVTLVKPGAIDTPYPRNAENYMDEAATVPAPVYAPDTVARALLHAAEHPQREVTVGGGGKQFTMLGKYTPELMDTLMKAVFGPQQRKDEPPRPDAESGLGEPAGELEERGDYEGYVAESSLYTRLRQRGRSPSSAAFGLGLVGIAYAGYRSLRGGNQ